MLSLQVHTWSSSQAIEEKNQLLWLFYFLSGVVLILFVLFFV